MSTCDAVAVCQNAEGTKAPGGAERMPGSWSLSALQCSRFMMTLANR